MMHCFEHSGDVHGDAKCHDRSRLAGTLLHSIDGEMLSIGISYEVMRYD